MGTEVLRPQDCLNERFRVGGPAIFPRRKPYSSGNPKPCRRSVSRPEPRKLFPFQSDPSVSKKLITDDSSKSTNNFLMGQVKILKRGESLDSKRKNESSLKNQNHQTVVSSSSTGSLDLVFYGTERLGPDPEMVPKQIRVADLKTILSPVAVRSDKYAGSAFSLSPSPRSLPLPSFFMKKDGLAIVDDSATKDLRRLLRLD
ncbi:hypothetical protein NE237_012465 [Protea cynaroides]|uniref:Uncharacterized protein n=1 Tax=Protea cynaroides TaxID=273540 RepID=A0A9Q0JY15_9MAGN|nr:hypothetical protein NE237_012465 [Protea cynaroides]